MDFSRISQIVLIIGASALAMAGCMDQYDPSPEHKLFKEESSKANRVAPKLTPEGGIPEPVAAQDDASVAVSPIDQKYANFCASCHGADGAANSPAANALNPKPRSFTDSAWQASVDDAHIAKVIKEGGPSVGLSATMAPWGAMLSDSEIEEMVAKVRSYAAQ